jgi:hypothetical protein
MEESIRVVVANSPRLMHESVPSTLSGQAGIRVVGETENEQDVRSRYDLEASPEFTVLGEVRNPGRYRSSGQAHLRDAIYQAGGETNTATAVGEPRAVIPGGGSRSAD